MTTVAPSNISPRAIAGRGSVVNTSSGFFPPRGPGRLHDQKARAFLDTDAGFAQTELLSQGEALINTIRARLSLTQALSAIPIDQHTNYIPRAKAFYQPVSLLELNDAYLRRELICVINAANKQEQNSAITTALHESVINSITNQDGKSNALAQLQPHTSNNHQHLHQNRLTNQHRFQQTQTFADKPKPQPYEKNAPRRKENRPASPSLLDSLLTRIAGWIRKLL